MKYRLESWRRRVCIVRIPASNLWINSNTSDIQVKLNLDFLEDYADT